MFTIFGVLLALAAPQAATAPVAETQPAVQQRVGVEPGHVLRLSLHDAMKMAEELNLTIQQQREDVMIAASDLDAARAPYDPALGANLDYTSQDLPQGAIVTRDNSSVLQSTNYVSALNASRLLPTGGTFGVQFNAGRVATNSIAALLDPTYQNTIGLTYTQPLQRNLFNDVYRHNLRRQERQLSVTQEEFQRQSVENVSAAANAYWNLAFAQAAKRVREEALKLAANQVRDNEALVQAKVIAPIEAVSARLQYQAQRDADLDALRIVTVAENALKSLILGYPDDRWNASIELTDRLETTPVPADLGESLKTALARRPEITETGMVRDQLEIDRSFFSNQRKPQLDLNLGYLTTGLAGGALPASTSYFGGFGTSINRLGSFNQPTVTFGFTTSYPFHNTAASAGLVRTSAALQQLDLREAQVRQGIEVEVRNAVQSVATASERVDASRSAREAAEEQLNGEMEKFHAGLSTTFFVLTRQNELSSARLSEAAALTAYRQAVAELQRVTFTTFEANGMTAPSLTGGPAQQVTTRSSR